MVVQEELQFFIRRIFIKADALHITNEKNILNNLDILGIKINLKNKNKVQYIIIYRRHGKIEDKRT